MTLSPGLPLDDAPARVRDAITRYAHRFSDNSAGRLRECLGSLFARAGIPAAAAVAVAPGVRADFLVRGSVAVTVRDTGSSADVAADLAPLAASPVVSGVVLVTPCCVHRAVPGRIYGKPVLVAWIRQPSIPPAAGLIPPGTPGS